MLDFLKQLFFKCFACIFGREPDYERLPRNAYRSFENLNYEHRSYSRNNYDSDSDSEFYTRL